MESDNITGMITKSNCFCLNEDKKHSFANILGSENDFLQSDCDEQLLLHLAFNQTVKLSSIQFNTLCDGSAPSVIKIYINKAHMGFDDATSMKVNLI